MPDTLYKFGTDDVFYNRLKTHPECQFYIYDSVVYYKNRSLQSGSFTPSVPNVSPGFINLYELNVDRLDGDTGLIRPIITKGGAVEYIRRNADGTVTTSDYLTQFAHGAKITGSYPLTASITREYFAASATRKHVDALKNTFNYYTPLSKHYQFSSSMGEKSAQALNLISIPSIFYGSSIKKGSVKLRYYITGTLAAELQDPYKNGELRQVSGTDYAIAQAPNGTSSVAGVILYDQGFIALTGAWDISTNQQNYRDTAANTTERAKWLFFGSTGSAQGTTPLVPSASYELSFEGVNYIPTITMMAHAKKGELLHSNNPTYPLTGSNFNTFYSASNYFLQDFTSSIKNTVKSEFKHHTASFEKQTFISKVGIYDKDKNLIAIAKLATPVKKTAKREFTFKIKLDL